METENIVVAYVPQNKNLTKDEHEKLIEDTLKSLEKIINSSKKIILVGNFNFSEVRWETYESRGENIWEVDY